MTPEVLRRARLGDPDALSTLACDRPTFALIDALGGFGPGGVPARPTACQASAAIRAWYRAAGWRPDGAAIVSPTGGTRLRFRERSIVVQRAERDALGRVRWVRHEAVPLQATVRKLAEKRGTCPRPLGPPRAANPPWSPEELVRRQRELEEEGLPPGVVRQVLRGELRPPRPSAHGLPLAGKPYHGGGTMGPAQSPWLSANPIRAWFGADRDPVNVTGPAFPGSTTYWSARFKDGEEGYLPAFDLYDRAGRRWLDPPAVKTDAWRNPPTGDARLRELERQARSSGAADDFSRWAQERLRRGEGPPPFQVKAVDLHDGTVRVARGYQASPILAYVVTFQPVEVERDRFEDRHVPWVAHLDRRGWFLQPRNGLFDPEPTPDAAAAAALVRTQAERAILQPPLYWEDLSAEEQQAMTARRSAELKAVLRRRYPTPAWYDDREWVDVLGPATRFPPYRDAPGGAAREGERPESALQLLTQFPYWADPRPNAAHPDRMILSPTALRDRPDAPPWVMASAWRKDRRSPLELSMARGQAKGPPRGQR